jgi:hypothetical protein
VVGRALADIIGRHTGDPPFGPPPGIVAPSLVFAGGRRTSAVLALPVKLTTTPVQDAILNYKEDFAPAISPAAWVRCIALVMRGSTAMLR